MAHADILCSAWRRFISVWVWGGTKLFHLVHFYLSKNFLILGVDLLEIFKLLKNISKLIFDRLRARTSFFFNARALLLLGIRIITDALRYPLLNKPILKSILPDDKWRLLDWCRNNSFHLHLLQQLFLPLLTEWLLFLLVLLFAIRVLMVWEGHLLLFIVSLQGSLFELLIVFHRLFFFFDRLTVIALVLTALLLCFFQQVVFDDVGVQVLTACGWLWGTPGGFRGFRLFLKGFLKEADVLEHIVCFFNWLIAVYVQALWALSDSFKVLV